MAERVEDFELPAEHHVIDASGTRHFVDGDTRKEVEHWLDYSDDKCLVITGVLGDDITLIRDKVGSIWSSSAEGRAKERAWNRAMDAEIPVKDRQ